MKLAPLWPILCVAGACAALLAAAARTSRVEVIDGDSLRIGGQELRLYGADAPEFFQVCHLGGRPYNCGQEAKAHMADLVAGGVQCEATSASSYGRSIVTCVASGQDVGEAMVRAGWALNHPRYGRRYVAAEREARENKRGMWAGTFDTPWEWRLMHPWTGQ